jgi:hypothetical protein
MKIILNHPVWLNPEEFNNQIIMIDPSASSGPRKVCSLKLPFHPEPPRPERPEILVLVFMLVPFYPPEL